VSPIRTIVLTLVTSRGRFAGRDRRGADTGVSLYTIVDIEGAAPPALSVWNSMQPSANSSVMSH
jgi:hypothetical protein